MLVVDSGSTIADEEKTVEPPPSSKVAFSISLLKPEEIQFCRANSAIPAPPNTPWSMVAIRDYGDDNKNPTIIFPPINHENLHISKDTPHVYGESSITSSPYNDEYSESDSYSYSDSDSNSNSSATFSPSDSSAVSASPLSQSPNAKSAGYIIALWFDSWVEILRSKLNNSTTLIWNNLASTLRASLTFRSATVTAMLLMFLYFRRRRRLREQEEITNQLIRIIKEKDEKIKHLLDQTAGMNQALLAFHRVPSSSST